MTSTLKTSLWLIFPHQLFDQLPEGVETVAMMEEPMAKSPKVPKSPKAPKTSETPKSPIEKKKGKGKKP